MFIARNYIKTAVQCRQFPVIQNIRLLSSENVNKNEAGGYAKAYEKFENIQSESDKGPHQTFASLLKNSRIIDLGDPENKIVTGKIFHIVDDDLYIDFGWKFHCVCPRPKKNAESYVRGGKVRLLIKELELSSKFLGYEKDLTLLEADCVLLGLQQERNTNLHTDTVKIYCPFLPSLPFTPQVCLPSVIFSY